MKHDNTKTGLAKLSPPRLHNVLQRDRLLEQLEQLSDYPVIWISAPGGSGKTVLAASYVQQNKHDAIWYQIDIGDSDPAAFFEYIEQAVNQHLDKPVKLPAFSPEYQKGIEAFARNFARKLFSAMGEHGLLVLDNFQELPQDAPTHLALKQFFAEIPLGSNLIVLSRSEPGHEYLRFRANGSIAVLDGSDIVLTEDEIQSVCMERLPELSKKDAKALAADIHRFTQGWAAGLVLMLECSGKQGMPQDFMQAGNHDMIFDYFAGEIFAGESDETRDFLLKTALMPFMTVELAEGLTRHPDTRDVLQNLTRRNYFTYASASTSDAYEYHPLFREFLLNRAETHFSAKTLNKLYSLAADLLLDHGWYTEGASLYIKAKQWKKLARLVSKLGRELMLKGRHNLLRSWLQGFPLEFLEQEPWMEYWLGMCMQPINTRDSRNYQMRAYEKFAAQNDLHGQLSTWCGIVETYIHDMSSFTELDHWINTLEELISQQDIGTDNELNARVAVAMFSALMYRQPDHAQLSVWEERVRQVILNTPDLTRRLGLGSQLLLYYTAWTGEIPKATVLLKALQQTVDPQDMEPLSQILWHSTLATYLWKTGHPLDSIKSVKQGLEVAKTFDVHVYNVLLLASGIYASCAQNKLDQAESYLQQMETSLNRNRLVDVVHYHYLAAGLAVVKGELGMAREYAEIALDAGLKSGTLYPETLARLILALTLIRQGNLTEVVFHLSRITDLAERIQSHSLNYLNRLVASEAAFSCGEMERAVSFLKQACEHEKDLGRVYHGFWWDRSLAENCIQALSQNLEVEFIQGLVRSHELIPASAPLHLDNWVWPIRIYTFGRFNITRYDENLSVTSKSSKKPLELLKVLIAHGARQVSQESMVELLWPDSEGDAAAQSLYTTTHRLRKLLGDEGVIMEDGRLTLDARYIWVDSLAFLRIAGLLQDKLMGQQAIHPGEIETLSEQFFHLYQGKFFGASEIHAAYMPMQEKLHLRFLKVAEILGHYWAENGENERGIQAMERALEIDPVVEEFYRSLMNIYHQVGRTSDAVKLFQRCRKNLSTILGVSPSKTTVDIYNSLQ